MSKQRLLDYGVIIYNVKPTEFKEAVTLADAEFKRRYKRPANTAVLPATAPAIDLPDSLQLADTYSSPGTVFVGVSK